MSGFDGEKYIPTIDAILSVSDLEQVSVKRIRNALQELFVVKFDENKKLVSDLILERYHNLMGEREEQKRRQKEIEEKDAILAAKLQNEPEDATRTKRTSSKNKLAAKPAKKRRTVSPSGNSLSSLELNLSPKLSELLGETRLPRTQVVKRVWDYVKEKELQNPNDRREIICDDRMKEIFGKKVTMFQLNKVLSQHLYKDDE
ncbi:hypothetical protein WICANDRAFT_60022 [Wickerhamomyces anomalus NRRL Y-366-8]|uniref:Uncharacterized protein n=1 Tax=Wickerhamomyces anomalus (strain ATCC 58044 / CBS 1984 / NCYC 433 / NRRL Y-366-8) TaxID=683960 RepID=A0A1E3P9A5_WICAA|nr:uncharacterized protein WICANDRAFT_60022 [Wickerhamomyces anomalus NRRL Y-366-8]ODQ61948.1 hypothetical protein WICANDRAFT_60022 [Wickerhamomyces anomalus NRRL Y-366-8]